MTNAIYVAVPPSVLQISV